MSERRKLQDLTIKDNFMFGAVMVDEELCREFLELALGFKFLKYVKAGLDESTEDFQDDFVQRLQDAVRNVKASREMEERYMLLEELLKEERENGRIEGKAEGKVEGKVEGKAESILELLSDLGEVPEELRKKILGEKDLDILKSYLKKASASKTIEEFQKLVNQL